MIPRLLKENDYFSLGIGLGYGHRQAYVDFMLKAFPKCKSRDYAAEWADRFHRGSHWACADKKRKPILREVYKVDE